MTTWGITTPALARGRAEADAGPAIALAGVTRRFRGGRGVGPVDLLVEPGEQLGLVGPNGAGKTTLLRLLATLERPRGGRIAWDGATSVRQVRRGLGLALDAPAEEETLSSRQAAYFWCRRWVRDRDRTRAAVDAGLERFGLAAVAEEPVAVLSFGMRRRLALVEALAHDPRLALLDEPTAGLDPGGVDVLVAELGRRAAAGWTTVVASNDPAAVARGCSRVVVLRDGLVAHDGAPGALVAAAAGVRVVRLDIDAPAGAELVARLREVTGVVAVETVPDGCEVRLRNGALADLVAVADDPVGCVTRVSVRGADLGDVLATQPGTTP